MTDTPEKPDPAGPTGPAPDEPEGEPKAGSGDGPEDEPRLADEFRAAAEDLATHLSRLPKAAAAALPTPRRVEARRPKGPNNEAAKPAGADKEKPARTQAPADNAAPETPAEPPAEPPIVARRLGAEPDMAQEAPPSPAKARPNAAERARARHRLKPPRIGESGHDSAMRRPLLTEIAALFVSLFFLGALAGLWTLFLVIAPWPENGADLWAVNRTPAIVIEDRNGEELAARGARYGERVAVDELPPYLVKAFLATEDRRFYEHRGVDLRGTMRALINNMKSSGRIEGGSTITQQLVKNLFLSPEQTYIRKAKEAMLAFWLEGRYSKDEILSLYLNRIYFGAGAYGVESAAKTYFDKSARDVTLSEAALLAGLPQAPSTLAPTQNPIGARERAFEVIDNLRETGDITEFDAREARRAPPVIAHGGEDRDIGWFFDYVAEKARGLAGPGAPHDIVIRTTLDRKLQRDAEAAVKSVLDVDAKVAGALEAAMIAYDNDGAVRAMVGGRSYIESQFNRATQAKRQPGSAFKPIVYAAAFENGVTPSTRFVDQPIDIAGWKPTNYDNTYRGAMRVTEAVAKSINTIAVQVSEKVGRPKVVEMARRLGISSEIPEKEAGIALGGFSATLEELTAAYIPFADGGESVVPYAVTEIADGRGNILYTRPTPKRTRVFDAAVAKDVTHVLYQVMTTGTGRGANLGNRQAAGKTGTTNDWRDAWFIGYTAQMTAGVWVGNDGYQPMDKITGGAIPARIWKNFMLAAHADLPKRPLDGAYPAVTYAEEGLLLSFYRDIESAFARVRRDGDEDRGRRRRR
ncbi:MAG: PBP1A family penicillin-binding protein [Parvularculaceae bacterium]|nr:PBP1A family penicillin-binding protein [Parvularculaceae bacterium]